MGGILRISNFITAPTAGGDHEHSRYVDSYTSGIGSDRKIVFGKMAGKM
jgi:hypothetical protein